MGKKVIRALLGLLAPLAFQGLVEHLAALVLLDRCNWRIVETNFENILWMEKINCLPLLIYTLCPPGFIHKRSWNYISPRSTGTSRNPCEFAWLCSILTLPLITFLKCILLFSTHITASAAVWCARNETDLQGLLCIDGIQHHYTHKTNLLHIIMYSQNCVSFIFYFFTFCLIGLFWVVVVVVGGGGAIHSALVWSCYTHQHHLPTCSNVDVYFIYMSICLCMQLHPSFSLISWCFYHCPCSVLQGVPGIPGTVGARVSCSCHWWSQFVLNHYTLVWPCNFLCSREKEVHLVLKVML